MSYLCTTNGTKGAFFPTMYRSESSGCSAVRLAHLLWEQGVPGSNPGTPTEKLKRQLKTIVEWQMPLYCRFYSTTVSSGSSVTSGTSATRI